jgi:sporulation protein YlmC with PRC-barrel domain
MKSKLLLLLGAALAGTLPLSIRAEASHERLGAEKAVYQFERIQIKNRQGQSLGRVTDLGVDLVNGRIVEVLVLSDSSLGVDNKIVAVPPLALVPDQLNEVYTLDASIDTFKSAAAIDLKNWVDSGRSERVAAAYKLFGQETYFLEEDQVASTTARRPKVALGYVERSSRILKLPVGNHQGHEFGKVWSLTMDIPKGRIMNVIILAPGNFQTKSIVPAMALSFNPARDGLLLDDTKEEYADEPRFVFTEAAFGNEPNYHRESYKGPQTSVALEQGSSYRDVDKTVSLYREFRAAKINIRHVEFASYHDRITLRGWVFSEDDKRRLNEIAVTVTMPEMVDNQISVGRPVASN